MKSVMVTRPGGPEAMKLVDHPEPRPAPGEALVEIAYAGVNFMDIGVRRGTLWTERPYPKVLGVEGAGRVLAVGDGAAHVAPGDRVAWVYAPGSYAERAAIPVEALVPIPDGVDDRTAAAVMMQGLTASHFATDFYPIREGDRALVHAAAGGVGGLLTQIIKMRGGIVIGRVSSPDKAAVAAGHGADHVVVDAEGRFGDEVLRLTDGQGVDVVYDGSGHATFAGSLASLRRCGTLCWFGPVLGAPNPVAIMDLPRSVKLGYAVYADHVHTPELLRARARKLFDWITAGALSVRIGGLFPLGAAADAQVSIEGRASTGKLLLSCS